ncbi:MAG: SLBB domain-containing protein [Sedimentisphaerales bacterium]
MRFRISRREWGLKGSGSSQSFMLCQKARSSFKTSRHFVIDGFSARFVSVILAILTSVSCPLLAQRSFSSTASPIGFARGVPTQGIYAVRLAEGLRLGESLTQQQAVSALARLGIEPMGGWQPNTQVDNAFLTDIRNSTIQASKRGAISAEQLSTVLRTVFRAAGGAIEPNDGLFPLPAEANEVGEGMSAIERLLSGEIPDVVSKRLTQFGYDVFRRPVSTFAPVMDVPVGPDYVVGPGDSFTITLWGRTNAQYPVRVNRNGEIILPEVGVLNISSMTLARLEDYLQNQLSRKYTDFKMAVTMSRLRTIRIYVVGESRTPGSYTLSSLSTVINALFAAGGPSKNGTLRKIRLLRNRQEAVVIDPYDFLLGGDKSKDVRLENEDTIFIPLIGPVVGVAGNVRRPAIYEMKEPTTVAEVLDLAGGVTHAGWLHRVQVERVQNHEKRIIVDFDMSGQTIRGKEKYPLQTVVQDGDMIKVFPVLPLEQNVVHLEGHVYRPGKYELKSGMRLRDIFSSYEVLQPQPNLEYGEIVRLVEPDFHQVVIPFNLGKVLEGDESENVELARFDTVRVFRWDERINKTVFISGFIYEPNEYRLVPDMKVSNLVDAAGGLMKNAYLKTAEITRIHISQYKPQTETIDIDLEKALAGVAEHNISLQDYDHLIVRPIPELEFDRAATISGEVLFPGMYPIRRGEKLSSLIERAGGFTERAYLKAAVFTRESAKAVQQEKLDVLIQKMEEEVLTRTERRLSGTMSEERATAQEPLIATQRELLAKLRAAEARGRVVVRVSEMDEFRGSNYDLELEPNDVLVIPEKPGVINIVGEVYNPVALLHEDNKTVAYYLNKVGGPTEEADKKHLSIIRADGSIASMSQKKLRKVAWDSENNHWFFGSFMNVKLDPGDTIMVPKKLDKYAWIRNTKDITQILFQLALPAGVLLGL